MPTNKKNIVIWEKWKDPFGMDDNVVDIISDIIDPDEETEEYDESFSPYENNTNDLVDDTIKKIKVPMIITPFGLIPYTENTASSQIFNFWVGHTNFSISAKIGLLIEETEGVETLDIFTRYRFRIAIGKAFKASEIMHNINENIYYYLKCLEDDKKN